MANFSQKIRNFAQLLGEIINFAGKVYPQVPQKGAEDRSWLIRAKPSQPGSEKTTFNIIKGRKAFLIKKGQTYESQQSRINRQFGG